MSSIFEEVGLTWKGQEYVIPANKVMGLIEVVEDVITLEELTTTVKRSKLSKAYLLALQYAGCKDATHELVYSAMFDQSGQQTIANAVNSILLMMIPPAHLQSSATPKKPQPKTRAKGKGSSVKRS